MYLVKTESAMMTFHTWCPILFKLSHAPSIHPCSTTNINQISLICKQLITFIKKGVIHKLTLSRFPLEGVHIEKNKKEKEY